MGEWSFGCIDCGQAQCMCSVETRQQRLGGLSFTVEPIPYAFNITETLPVVRTVIAQAHPTMPDDEILKTVMRAVRGFANPEKVREQIQSERRKIGGPV